MILRVLVCFLLLIIGFAVYVRLAPTDVGRWHRLPEAAERNENLGHYAQRRLMAPGAEVLAALEQRALGTARTRLIAGSVGEGMLTFQTRSKLWGFPDFTTVTVQDDQLQVYGRLRFGKADMGVNKARVLGWIDALGPLTEAI